ncbi:MULTISPECIES: DUF6961 family protein [Sphingobium]|jgi:hypothetical protein|uniref:Uncharacterized protein n=1 Tax=Sphingobium yanoikuyae TaxID=13690 RepID=A0A3G2UQ10_SPHYA|nr:MULTISPECIES: hypothetical protein [Sphingobium]AYO77290.1 hypothetical protein EBF16_10560 [Sphingobium yanoikuyae]MDV3481181.1 hypothetical protein [Sphingobium yanoikuyae]PHP18960.1 hypothetical protein CG471_14715 [Sphingobium sp. IP1]QNG48563.1 hypothetical protein H3V42_14165 [Sphingobium yanoikuyae]
MTFEQERWAEALAIERRFGESASQHMSDRVTALALAEDWVGVGRWFAIIDRFDKLQDRTTNLIQ